ncbi:MAG: ribosome small subunit-dependent GTPase A [Bacteroidetes bacterium]|nr:ribosome small subunit-dependent GTPase A [Bacteroidota bacterium]
MKGRIYKSTGNWYRIKSEDGNFINARLKGKFKIDDITSSNPIAVGDYVEYSANDGAENIVITEILKRENYINRISPANRNQHHIIASNLDQSLLFASFREPKTSLGFIDRFLVTAEAYHVPAIIVFNKVDLYKEKELAKLEMAEELYSEIGYRVLRMSIKSGEGLAEVSELLKNKTTLLTGHSGVGKSSFINYILPDINLKTKEVSNWSGKGLHTTTFAEMYDLPAGGSIIDTPGIRELGLADIAAGEVSHYYPEMRELIHFCRFNNCIHTDELDCAVKDAVATGKIHEERYINYLKILESMNKQV